MDRNLRNQHPMMSSGSLQGGIAHSKRHSASHNHYASHHHNSHHHSGGSSHGGHHHHQHSQHQSGYHSASPHPQSHTPFGGPAAFGHSSNHSAGRTGSPTSAGGSASPPQQQHNKDIVRFVEDQWHKVASEHGTRCYYNPAPNQRLLSNFKPFDLEQYSHSQSMLKRGAPASRPSATGDGPPATGSAAPTAAPPK